MSSPIKSNIAGANASGLSPALHELMNKLGTQTQGVPGGEAENPQLAFSRWLEKHAIGAGAARRSEAPSTPGAVDKPHSQALQNGMAASRAAEQALARARQMTSSAAKPMTQQAAEPNARPEAAKPAKARNEQTNTSKSGRKEGAAKPEANEGAEEAAAKDDKEVSFNTAAGEGAAVVRELTPPPTIQPGDSAGMMAWLASLTQGDANLQPLAAGELSEGQTAQGDGADDAALMDLTSKGKGPGRHLGGATLELQAWQGVSGKADAAMEQLGQGGRLEADPMAGLMAGATAKAPGFSQILNDAAQNVRHESATLNAPFGSPEFPQALADKVSMWVNTSRTDGPMTAELHLNPAEMGPINVKISLDGQSAHVDFAAAALETRQAIEASLSMLSSALSDVGLSLTGGGVSSQTSQQAFEQAAGREGTGARTQGGREWEAGEGEALDMRQVAAPRPGRAGGLDLYA